jgi:hypothetical protein
MDPVSITLITISAILMVISVPLMINYFPPPTITEVVDWIQVRRNPLRVQPIVTPVTLVTPVTKN